jgi:uncharacterized Zn-binding protein involved in type VI secretion
MHLQAALGFSSSQMYGESDAVSEAPNRSLAIAEQNGDTAHQAEILKVEHYFHARKGDLKSAFECARRCAAIAETSDELTVKALAHAMLGRALQTSGDIASSRAELDALWPPDLGCPPLEPPAFQAGTSPKKNHHVSCVSLLQDCARRAAACSGQIVVMEDISQGLLPGCLPYITASPTSMTCDWWYWRP